MDSPAGAAVCEDPEERYTIRFGSGFALACFRLKARLAEFLKWLSYFRVLMFIFVSAYGSTIGRIYSN